MKFKARILSDALHTLRNKIYSSGEVELFFGRDEYASIQESIRFQNIVTDPDKLVSFVREEVKKRVVK